MKMLRVSPTFAALPFGPSSRTTSSSQLPLFYMKKKKKNQGLSLSLKMKMNKQFHHTGTPLICQASSSEGLSPRRDGDDYKLPFHWPSDLVAPKISIIMSSQSDLDIMKNCAQACEENGVSYEMRLVPAEMITTYAMSAANRGIKIIFAYDNGEVDLSGQVANITTVPVIAVFED